MRIRADPDPKPWILDVKTRQLDSLTELDWDIETDR